jgi:hypothetical protein
MYQWQPIKRTSLAAPSTAGAIQQLIASRRRKRRSTIRA